MCFEKPPKKLLFETHVASGRITADYHATFGSTRPSGMTRPYPRNPSGFRRIGCQRGPAGTGSSPAGAAGSAGNPVPDSSDPDNPAPGTRLPEAEYPGGSGHRGGTGILRGAGRPRGRVPGIPAGSGGTQGSAEEPAGTRVLPDLPSPGSPAGAAG